MSLFTSLKDSLHPHLWNRLKKTSLKQSVFLATLALCGIVVIGIVWQINVRFLVSIPSYGGSITEGIVGSPRFINPLLASSDVDKDISSLVYSGLMKLSSDGVLVPDLAESYTVSDDGRTYTFTLKKDIYFQDGIPLTVDDVAFTIEKAQDSLIRSPKQANWDSVKIVVIDPSHIQFILPQAYSPFLENTTLGILPAHIWRSATPEQFSYSLFNIKPIGSGPYRITTIKRGSSGLPTSYILTSFAKYISGEPYIKTVIIKLFDTNDGITQALSKGTIDSAYDININSLTSLSNKYTINESLLPRVFGVFFNTDVQPLFLNKEVRQALDEVVDRNLITDTVFGGYATPVDSPLPPSLMNPETTSPGVVGAAKILTDAGWEKNPDTHVWEKTTKKGTETLSFTLSTSNAPDLSKTADILKQEWESFGARVDLSVQSVSELNQNVIRPREYQALLFGTSVGRQGDLYSFWHSSERNDPGLNIALYTNIDTDKILERLRQTTDIKERAKLYASFTNSIRADTPAIFLYSPSFIYLTATRIKNVHLGILNSPAERFADISNWYVETQKVWKVFEKNTQ